MFIISREGRKLILRLSVRKRFLDELISWEGKEISYYKSSCCLLARHTLEVEVFHEHLGVEWSNFAPRGNVLKEKLTDKSLTPGGNVNGTETFLTSCS